MGCLFCVGAYYPDFTVSQEIFSGVTMKGLGWCCSWHLFSFHRYGCWPGWPKSEGYSCSAASPEHHTPGAKPDKLDRLGTAHWRHQLCQGICQRGKKDRTHLYMHEVQSNMTHNQLVWFSRPLVRQLDDNIYSPAVGWLLWYDSACCYQSTLHGLHWKSWERLAQLRVGLNRTKWV